MTNTKNKNTFKPLSDSQEITSPEKILRLLERFTKGYNPLTIQILGHKELHTSSIISVDKKQVLLDELLPATGHQLLLTEQSLQATGKLEGVDVRFVTSLKHVDDTTDTLSFYMSLPKVIEYRQRRLNYRAHVPVSMQLPVIIGNKNSFKVKGTLRDLSFGGAGIIFLADRSQITTGTSYECIIELPDGQRINCSAEPRYSKNIPSQKTQLVGVQFSNLLPEQSRHIGNCINELEREFIKKRAAYK